MARDATGGEEVRRGSCEFGERETRLQGKVSLTG
jgi:hypothetical protein